MDVFSIISLFGGLALFLYGMEVMGDGLKSISASALKKALSKVTGNIFVAFFLGFFITCVIQSSTATIVLTVGLLGAGVLELRPALGIVFGANVGTTITAQIIRLLDVGSSDSGVWWLDLFTPKTLAPIAVIFGVLFIKFIKKNTFRSTGTILMGFGLLFIGLLNMTSAMEPLAESDAFKNIVARISSPFIGLLSGTVITALVQSSSAAVGILQSLCTTGVMNFSLCFSYVIGAALGTCITTAAICSIGTKANAKRAVFVHVLFSIFGGTLFMAVILLLHRFGVIGDPVWTRAMSSGDVANFETFFKLVTALILLPFAGQLEKLSCRVIHEKKSKNAEKYAEIEENIQALDTHLFLSPSVALDQTAHVISHMGELALENYNAAVSLIWHYDNKVRETIEERETMLDRIADASNNYLVELSPHVKSDKDNERLNLLLRSYTEFERMGDLAVNLAEGAETLYANNTTLSENGQREMKVATDAVRETLETAIACYAEGPDVARHVEPLEEVVDDVCEMLKANHIERLKAGKCSIHGGMVFMDMLVNLERISDQCSNLAVDVLSVDDMAVKGNEHDYIEQLHSGKDAQFAEEYRRNAEKYLNVLRQ